MVIYNYESLAYAINHVIYNASLGSKNNGKVKKVFGEKK